MQYSRMLVSLIVYQYHRHYFYTFFFLVNKALISQAEKNCRKTAFIRINWLKADCSPLSTSALHGRSQRLTYQMLWNTIWTSWRWAYCCSKHVELSNVIHILQNKEIVHHVGDKNKFIAVDVSWKLNCIISKNLSLLCIVYAKCIKWTRNEGFITLVTWFTSNIYKNSWYNLHI
jgi:hypothetical protein